MTKEEFNAMVESVREKLDESTKASLSEDFLGLMSTVDTLIDTIDSLNVEVSSLKEERDDLLKVNGRLFQKIGYEKEENEEKEEMEESMEEIAIEEIIDEKGEMI